MEKTLEQIRKEAKKIYLSPTEKTSIREMLLLYAKENPIQVAGSGFEYRDKRLAYINVLPLSQFKFKPMPIAILLAFLLVAGTGTTIAAENSLPGDLLHPVKINVTENVLSVLAFSPEGKAEFEVERADRRLEEVEELAIEGKLTSDLLEQVRTLFEKHSSRALTLASEAGRDDTIAEIQSDLETMIKLHGKVLAKVKTESIDDNSSGELEIEVEFEDFIDEVEHRGRDARQARLETELRIQNSDQPAAKAAAEAMFRVAQNKLSEVRRFIGVRTNRVEQSVVTEANSFLQEADNAVSRGNTILSAGNNSEAFISFDRAVRLAQTAKRLVASGLAIQGISLSDEAREIRQGISSEADRIRFRARLTSSVLGSNAPWGHADFEERSDRMKFNVEVEDVDLPMGTRLSVFLRGASVATLVLNEPIVRGGKVDLDSRDGETVPNVQRGDLVRVEGPNGFVLAGTFDFKDLDEGRGGNDNSGSDDRNNGDNSGPGSQGGENDENELRGRDNEPGEDIRGNNDENELRGRDNEPGEDIRGNDDENEIDDSSGGGSGSGSGGGNNDDDVNNNGGSSGDDSSSGSGNDDSSGGSGGSKD